MASEEISKEEIELVVAEPEPSETSPLDKNKTKGLANGSKFTVTKVSDAEHHRNYGRTSVSSGRSPMFDTINENSELMPGQRTPNDTLTNNSITALLSSKWRDLSRKIRDYGEKTRFRKRIVSKWESLNYDTIENELHWQDKEKPNVKKETTLKFINRWLVVFFTGIFTALMAAVVHISVEKISSIKFSLLRDYLDRCAKEGCLYQPAFIWLGLNLGITLLGALLVIYVQPLAAGSGVPYIKAYLNGLKIPGLLTLECFIAKVGGVVLSILGGLFCGKEGPMAHSGGIIAAGMGKGRIRLCRKKRVSMYEGFRDDHEIRDFVSGGAASGVSAAFGAPVGGTLFSVEEAASFWSQELTWRVFFAAMVACFFTNFLLSAFHGTPNQLSDPGLVRFDVFHGLAFDLIEIPVFLVMAVVGGLIGASFVVLNYKLTVFRNRFIKLKWLKAVEAMAVAMVTGLVSFAMLVGIDTCTDKKPYDDHAIVSQMHCSDGEHNSFSTLFLTTPEGCLKALLHDPYGSFGPVALVVFVVVFFFMGVWTYGLSVSSGVFIPSLVIGAAWGRLFGIAVVHLFPGQSEHYPLAIFCACTDQVVSDLFGNHIVGFLMRSLVCLFYPHSLTSLWNCEISQLYSKYRSLGFTFGDGYDKMGRNETLSGSWRELEVGKYALVGAASQLGGILRTTISLTVIIVECTGEISFGLPIMIVLMISKWVGDFISTGLYDMNIEVLGLPMLPWEPPALCDTVKASDIMNAPALSFNKVEKVGRIIEVLRNETFCGFPVVNAKGRDHSKPSKVRGLILRSQLLVLLKHRVFAPDGLTQPNTVRLKDFRKYYLQYLKIKDIKISDEEMDYMMDLRPYLTPNPYTIEPTFSLPRLFKLFRGLGLRHLIVVNDVNEPIGMITRKDLAKFRVESKRGLVKVEQLNIEDK